MSASESIWAPNFVEAFSRRATRPSMPSRNAATSTIATAISKRCSKARRMPDRPAQIANTVIRLGMSILSGISRMRGPPRPCGSNRWNNPAMFALRNAYQRRHRSAAELGNHGFAGDRCLANRDPWCGILRQKNIDPRTEADQPNPVSHADVRHGLHEADDTSRNQPRDLDGGHRPVRAFDHHAVPLVLVT